MADPMMATSSIPLPSYQTMQGVRDPLPMTSPAQIEKTADSDVEADRQADDDSFKAYLDKANITILEKASRQKLDAADLISQASIYSQPGVAFPV